MTFHGAPRKNPLLRTKPPLLPPAVRSRAAQGLTAAAALGRFKLQVCPKCAAVHYPPVDVCGQCLRADPPWRDVSPLGTLAAASFTVVSNDPYFRERSPWRIGTVRLDCGPSVIAHLHRACTVEGRVRLAAKIDRGGAPVMFALPALETPDLADDPQFAEMVAEPRDCRILITDGRNPVGAAAARELLKNGAQRVFVGVSQTWKPYSALNDLETAGAEIVALDVTDDDSVSRVVASIGGQVDILVNTGDCVRPGGIVGVSGQDHRMVTETVHLGLVRLARSFGPAMAARGGDSPFRAVAWVNVLSVFALATSARYGAYSAASAAALGVARSLRSELGVCGIRVINLFTGPTDTEWFQELPPPKVSAPQIGRGVLTALREGLEEAAVGDVAAEIVQRFYSNPKEAERMADQLWRLT
jgi:NAD(P)-dependent dehydrogenase (short-subunit alcohol dehydrogenase family)/uncharacterized OB-fold protein